MNRSEYNHQYYLKNRDRIRRHQNEKYNDLSYQDQMYKKHMRWYHDLPKTKKDKLLESMRIRGRNNRKEVKKEVMKLCGKGSASCLICKISDIDVLTIDHINGRQGESRKSNDVNLRYYGYSLWQKILKGELNKSEYQTLCMNCNWKRHLTKIRNVSVSQ